MRFLILFLVLAGQAVAGCFVHPTNLVVAMRGNPVSFPSPWVSITRPQALVIQAIPYHFRKWVTDHVEEMSQSEKDAVIGAAETVQAGVVFIRWNASRLAIAELNILFPTPSTTEQDVIDSVTDRKASLKAELAALGVTVP